MGQLFKNNFESTLAVAIASTDVVPMNVQVAPGDGDGAPLIATIGADYFDVTLENAAGQIEIFRIKQRTSGSDVLVVHSRAREGTTAQNWSTSPATVVGLRVTAAAVEETLAHAADGTDAHPASAITNTPAGNLAATTVQAALNELDTEKEATGTAAAAVSAHTGDGTDAHAASAITNTPAGNIAATTVQAAINELDSEKQAVHANLTAESGLTGAADKLAYYTGAGAKLLTSFLAWGRTFLASATIASARTSLATLFNVTDAKSANYTALLADRGKVLDFTGTRTLALTAVATLGAAYSIAVRNSGTGVVTIDPDGSELIDGVASIDLAAGESCIVCANDGATAWKTVGRVVSLPAATASVDGYMTSTYATKLDGIEAGATVGVPVDVGASGVGMMAYLYNNTSPIASGATVSGAGLLGNSVAMTGTWRNIENTTIASYVSGTFQRIS